MNVKLQRSRRRQDVLIWAVLWYLVVVHAKCAYERLLKTISRNIQPSNPPSMWADEHRS